MAKNANSNKSDFFDLDDRTFNDGFTHHKN